MDAIQKVARIDALATAKLQLATEREAVAYSEDNGHHGDARAARREVARLETLITRLESRLSEGDRFVAAARAQHRSHGGRPTSALVDGRIVFTYPDGTKTCGGVRVDG